MAIAEPVVRVLLLVEDNPADADLVRSMLEQAGDHSRVDHVGSVADATRRLRAGPIDVVLLDLHLPDASGVESIRAVRDVAGDVPIVVLTGNDNEDLAISCLDAGAQDYQCKADIRPTALSRSIEYAIGRIRQGRRREFQDTQARHRTLSTTTTGTSVTGAIAGAGAVSRRYPNAFQGMVRDYTSLLDEYLDQSIRRSSKPREAMERIVTRLGDAGAGPRDLMDVHIAALDAAVVGCSDERARSLSVEGRLLALEMMGMLLDYYRVGTRRSYGGQQP